LKSGYYPAFDGLRGVAVLLVILLHTGVVPFGWIGVDLFFVLSGFLITDMLLHAKASGASRSSYFLKFYVRRSVRILPLAILTMTFVFLIVPSFGLMTRVPIEEQFWYWSFLSNWWTQPRSIGAWAMTHFWSLALEIQYYLLWPAIVLAANRRSFWWVCVALFLLSPILRFLVTLMPVSPSIWLFYDRMTPLRMDGVAAGAIIAIVSRETARLGRYQQWAVPLFLLSVGTFTLVQWFARDGFANFVLGSSALAAGGAACLACILTDSPLFRFLEMRLLVWIGTLSYGAYVIHFPLITTLNVHGAKLSVIAILGVAFGLAAISWYFLEAPLMRLVRGLELPQQATSPNSPPDVAETRIF
jgi:peptidoglycan/LPS O-acetylase OafA/YrhL